MQAEELLEKLQKYLCLEWIYEHKEELGIRHDAPLITQQVAIVPPPPEELARLYDLEIAVAIDGESAIEMAEYDLPDLILLDVQMPGIDGFETCQRLKANPLTQNIPVIFMTALADTEDKVKGLSLGAVDYITKPFQQEEVLARIRVHLKNMVICP